MYYIGHYIEYKLIVGKNIVMDKGQNQIGKKSFADRHVVTKEIPHEFDLTS